jgi:hypothetical protein
VPSNERREGANAFCQFPEGIYAKCGGDSPRIQPNEITIAAKMIPKAITKTQPQQPRPCGWFPAELIGRPQFGQVGAL